MMIRYIKCMFLLFWAVQINLYSQTTAQEMYETGFDFHYGKNGQPKDDEKAVEWFRKAADQGHAEAQAQLGYMYLYGYGVDRKYYEAIKWYRKAAEQENVSAQVQLGYMYLNGYGVVKDYAEALKWYGKAANQGHPSGMNGLGFMYQNGYGVNKDYAEAIKWYRMAAEKGNVSAKSNIATMYFNGFGVDQDYAEAFKWYREAAEQGEANGQYSLAFMYENGYGVSKSRSEAKKWYEKAAAQGDEDAKNRLEKIEQEPDILVEVEEVEDLVAKDTEPSKSDSASAMDGNEKEGQVFEVVDQVPEFSGNVFSWLSRNIHYPPMAQENNVQGRVVVSFIVEADGSVSDVQVVKGVAPSLDNEALRVVKSMPKWEPGLQDGKPVRVRKNLPVTFKLQ